MKNLFIVFLQIAAFQNGLFAQSWFADNPVWTSFIDPGQGGFLQEAFTIGGDTILGGRVAQKFTRKVAYLNNSSPLHYRYRYGYESGDTLFVWHPSHKVYYPLYSFALSVGDTLRFVELRGFWWEYAGDTIGYVVDSLFATQVGNTFLRGQKIKKFYNSSTWGEGIVLESVGLISEFFHHSNGMVQKGWPRFFMDERNESAHDGYSSLLCQFQNGHFIYQTSHQVCAFMTLPAPEPFAEKSATISPNPNDGSFLVLLPENELVEEVEAIDLMGKRWALKRIDLERFEENSPMPAGLYFLVIKASGGKTRVAKMQHF